MKKVIIDGWYQLQEFPSVAYTPANFWDTMNMIESVEVVNGRIPELKGETDAEGRPFKRNPFRYHATFYFKPYDVVIAYRWRNIEATVTLFGEKERIDTVEGIIRREHRMLSEKLAEREKTGERIADLVEECSIA